MAPSGQETLTVVVPVGHIDEAAPQDWASIRQRARQFVLRRLAQVGVDDLDAHIKFEVSYTPLDWQSRYNLSKGAGYGLSHNFLQMGYLRPHNRHARYRNLYFVGASTHPGAGLPTVLISARLATERILRDAGGPRLTQR
jgi:phytoene dehydrogenase-like protein